MKSLSHPHAWPGAFGQVEADPGCEKSGHQRDNCPLLRGEWPRLCLQALDRWQGDARALGKVFLLPTEESASGADLLASDDEIGHDLIPEALTIPQV